LSFIGFYTKARISLVKSDFHRKNYSNSGFKKRS
ncbi:MAG: hypothetical protein ACI83I_002826, partial [Bacteroidia bacterium]